jgi:hypothetical protein
MTTKIYGASDDLIEFQGDVYGEVGHYGTDNNEKGDLIICSDGTLLEIKYGKADMVIWGITVLNEGNLFEHLQTCMDEDAEPHSDLVLFKDGLKWAYVATEWEKAK